MTTHQKLLEKQYEQFNDIVKRLQDREDGLGISDVFDWHLKMQHEMATEVASSLVIVNTQNKREEKARIILASIVDLPRK